MRPSYMSDGRRDTRRKCIKWGSDEGVIHGCQTRTIGLPAGAVQAYPTCRKERM